MDITIARQSDPLLLLSADPTGRFLINQEGVPFQLRGDAAWALAVQLTREDLTTYFNDRQINGFNSFIFEVINSNDGFATNAPANAYGDLPFTGTPFASSLNEPYWQHIDYIYKTAAKRGMVALTSAAYEGVNGGSEGWYSAMVSAGASNVQAYGAAIAARYLHQDNIIWVNGGDYRPPTLTIPNALATGILSADTRHLFTTHWARDSTGTDGSPSWLTLNSSYTHDNNIDTRVLADYLAAPSLADFVVETYYEGTFSGQPTLTATQVRREMWQSMLSGACGHMFGNHLIWSFDTSWKTGLNSGGAISMRYLASFFQGIQWWTLIPDSSSNMVTSGRGSTGSTTYVTAGVSADRRLGVAYIPGGGAVSIAMSLFAGTVTALWYDPTAGTFSTVSGSPFTNSGSQSLTPPSGAERVLLLQVPS